MKDKLSNPSEVTAADLTAIRGFLKDNGITALPVEGKPLKELADAAESFTLPFPSSISLLPPDDPAVKGVDTA